MAKWINGALSTDVFRMRFGLAPTSSSPSRKRTRRSTLFSTNRFGIDPPSRTSSTNTNWSIRASADRRSSMSLVDSVKIGKTDEFPWRSGSSTRSLRRATGIRASPFRESEEKSDKDHRGGTQVHSPNSSGHPGDERGIAGSRMQCKTKRPGRDGPSRAAQANRESPRNRDT